MTYKGITITEPTLEMFDEFIRETNLPIVAEDVYNHYKIRNWLTKKGTIAKSVEVLCNSWNSIPSHRIGVIQGNSKVKTESINWEYRRYELSKQAMHALISDCNRLLKHPEKIATDAVYYADALINELKNNYN